MRIRAIALLDGYESSSIASQRYLLQCTHSHVYVWSKCTPCSNTACFPSSSPEANSDTRAQWAAPGSCVGDNGSSRSSWGRYNTTPHRHFHKLSHQCLPLADDQTFMFYTLDGSVPDPQQYAAAMEAKERHRLANLGKPMAGYSALCTLYNKHCSSASLSTPPTTPLTGTQVHACGEQLERPTAAIQRAPK